MLERKRIGNRTGLGFSVSAFAAAATLTVFGVVGDGTTASAQNALGDGRALDANPQVGSGGLNQRGRSIEDELRFRNAIVTGNAAGGFAFRDFVGYSAAGDFTGELGSDDIFAFQRDSLFSGLASRNIRGIDALQQTMALSTGGLPNMTTASAIVARPGRGAVGADMFTARDQLQEVDVFSGRPRAMRSTSEYFVSTQTDAAPFAAGVGQDGVPMLFSSSPLRGVFVEPYPGHEATPSLSAPTTTRADDRVSSRLEPVRSTYDQILREFSALGRPPEPDAAAQPDAPDEEAAPDQFAPETEGVIDDSFLSRVERLRQELLSVHTQSRPVDAEPFDVTEETTRLFGDATPLVERFIDDPSVAEGAYTRHIAEGQRLLGLGQWFDAEETFTRALLRRAGDPIASVGRVHAQLGAGMPLSAAVNLRALFRAHPELIPVRYGSELLPREPRKASILEMLRTESKRNDGFGRDAAFLLAYLGYQFEMVEEVRAGFAAITRIDEYLNADTDPLFEALRAVWLKRG